MAKKYTWLEESFGFYASYHDNAINKAIHIVFVWMILWTACLFLQYTPQVPGTEFLNDMLPDGMIFNYALLVGIAYFLFYFFVELPGVVGPLAAAMMAVTLVTTSNMKNAHEDAYKLGTVLHVAAWIAQFIGHGVFEKRAPALFDNLLQAFVMAPLFVVMEVFFMVGYKPKFSANIAEIVKENKRIFAKESASKGQKKSS